MKFNVINVLGVSMLIEIIMFIVSGFGKSDAVCFTFGISSIFSIILVLALSLVGHRCGKYISKCCCDIGWHTPVEIKYLDNDPLHFQQEAKCKYCGYKGLIDGQGNLF